MQDVLTTCVYCGCGCALYLHTDNGQVTGSSPSRNHPVSRNNLCVKGWHVHEFIHNATRLKTPLLRKNGVLEPVSWSEALAFTVDRFQAILDKSGGGKALGVLSSAKCTNEENYLIQKFARAVLKTNNVDHCARL